MYVDHYGKLEIININTQDTASLNFHKKGWFEKVSHDVVGIVTDNNENNRFKLNGQWNSHMNILDLATDKSITAWSKYPFPEGYDHNYYFSEFAIQLNIPGEMFPGLPITDSRFRPDQRALENGDIKLAGSEKNRLEEKQREARKIREVTMQEYQPKWFYMKDGEWIYAGGYWEAKDSHHMEEFPNIF